MLDRHGASQAVLPVGAATGAGRRNHSKTVERTGAWLALLSVMAAACGNGDRDNLTLTTTTSSTSSTSAVITSGPSSTTSTSGSSTTTTTPATTTTTQQEVFAYPGGGPPDPVVPPGTPAFDLLSRGQCSELLARIDGSGSGEGWGRPVPGNDETTEDVDVRTYHLYRAAAQACLLRWDGALKDFNALTALGARFGDQDDPSCPEDVLADDCVRCREMVYEWLANLVTRRRADPKFTPRFVRGTQPRICTEATTTTSSTSTTSSTTTTSSTSTTQA